MIPSRAKFRSPQSQERRSHRLIETVIEITVVSPHPLRQGVIATEIFSGEMLHLRAVLDRRHLHQAVIDGPRGVRARELPVPWNGDGKFDNVGFD